MLELLSPLLFHEAFIGEGKTKKDGLVQMEANPTKEQIQISNHNFNQNFNNIEEMPKVVVVMQLSKQPKESKPKVWKWQPSLDYMSATGEA